MEAEVKSGTGADWEAAVVPMTRTTRARQQLGSSREEQAHQAAPFASHRLGALSETEPALIPVAPQKLPRVALRSVRAALH